MTMMTITMRITDMMTMTMMVMMVVTMVMMAMMMMTTCSTQGQEDDTLLHFISLLVNYSPGRKQRPCVAHLFQCPLMECSEWAPAGAPAPAKSACRDSAGSTAGEAWVLTTRNKACDDGAGICVLDSRQGRASLPLLQLTDVSLRVRDSWNRRSMNLGSHATPSLAPPRGKSKRANFHVFNAARLCVRVRAV